MENTDKKVVNSNEEQLAALKAKVEILEPLVEQLQKENADLTSKLEKVSEAKKESAPQKIELPEPFEIGGNIYRFLVGAFKLDGVKYISAKEVKNKDLVEQLVKIGSSVIEKVDK
jgi:hypothetical protein